MSQMIPGPLTYDEKSSSDSREFFKLMPLDGGQINPDLICFFDDFTLLHGKALNATDMYDASIVTAGGAAIACQDVLGGVVRLTSQATTDNSGCLLQCTFQSLAFQTGKKLWFEARVKVSDADQGELFVGLAKAAATAPENLIATNLARVGFELVDGDASLMFSCNSGSNDSRVDTGVDMADATYIKLGFFYNGSTIDVYVNRVKKLTGISPRLTVGTDLISPAIMHLAGDASGTHTAEMDYWMVVAER